MGGRYMTSEEIVLFARANGQTVEQYLAWLSEQEEEDPEWFSS